MIRRSRISVRPNVRPVSRPTITSQDTSKKNQDFSPHASVGSELTEPAPEQPLFTPAEACKTSTQKPELEMAASCQNDVSQSSKLVSGPPRRKMAPNLSLSKPHYSPASTEMDSETTGPQSTSPHRRTLSPRNLATSVKSIRPKVSINTDETLPSTASVPVKADGRVAINTDGTLPSTVKADGKAPHRPRGRQRPAAVPRQSRVNHSEDIQSHAQQQPDINSFNKGKEQGESNSEEEIALKETTSPQSDPFSCMQSLKDSEVSKPRSSSEQDPTPTPEKASYKQTNKSLSAMRGLNDPADLIRLGKAQKLREMLKLEVCKERSQKTFMVKSKRIQCETLKDHSRMTMRELIYYLPKTNPMKCQEKDQNPNPQEVTISSPVSSHVSEERPAQHSEESPAQPKQHIQSQSVGEHEQEHEEDVADLSESEANEALLVPQVKVAEDGSLIIDEESLTVEVLRQKGPNLSADRDPIFERGSTTTYSSFRKGTYTKPWSSQETDMFFLAISMVGTDFSMIGSMFPHRARCEIKNKFKKEERANAWRIDKAFREKRRLDLDFFTGLLEKILADEERRKKNRVRPSLGAKVQQRREKKKPRARKTSKAATDTEDSAEEDLIGDFTEGEKENEDRVNELGTVNSKKTKNSGEGGYFSPKRDKQTTPDAESCEVAAEDPGRPAGDESSLDDGAEIAATLMDDRRDSMMRPTQLACDLEQQGELSKPHPRRSGKAVHRTSQNAQNGDCATEETEEASSQMTRRSETSSTPRARKRKKQDVEANEELPSKPSRSKRLLKLPRPQVPKERSAEIIGDTLTDSNDSPLNVTKRSKPAAILYGGQKKRTGLVTLRASVSEEDMEIQEAEIQEPEALQDCDDPTNPEDQNQVPAFVPVGLRSPLPVHAVVEETVEEGVIDFIAPENLEASEDSYKEAAQTLLTIGNPGHVRQSTCAPNTADQEQADEQPTDTHADPGTADEQPTGTHTDPVTADEQPTETHTDPGPADEQPTATHTDPVTADEQPTETHTDPGPADEQPTGTHTEPGPADVSSEPGPADVSSEPGPADVSSEPVTADVSSDPGPADVSSEPGPADVSSDPGPADVSSESVTADVSSEPGTSLCGASFIGSNLNHQGAAVSTGVSQLAETNCEEPVFIISLTEISPSFIETLPSDTDTPLSHTELLYCNPEPLPSLPETLSSDTQILPCLNDTLPLRTESLPSFSEMCLSPPEPLTSLTEPHNLVTDIVPSLKEPLPPITDDLPTVPEPLCSLTKPSPVTAQSNTGLETRGNGDLSEADRRTVPHLLVTDALMPVPNEKKQPERSMDISSPPNLTLASSAIQPDVSTNIDPPQKSRGYDGARRGKTQVQPGLPSRRTSAKCISAQALRSPPVSQICKTHQPSSTQLAGALSETSSVHLPKSRVKGRQARIKEVTVAALGDTQSFCPITPQVPVSTNSDNLQTAKGTVSHLLIPDALVPCDLDADDRDQLHDTGAAQNESTPPFWDKPITDCSPDISFCTNTKANLETCVEDLSEITMDQCRVPRTEEGIPVGIVVAERESWPLLHVTPMEAVATVSDWSVPEDDARAVSAMIITDALVPVSVETENKQEREEKKRTKTEKPENLTTTSSTHENVARSSAQLASDGLTEDISPLKKRRLLESTRRAKLHVKPALPVRRISSQNALAQKSMPPLSSTQSSSASHSASAQPNSTPSPASAYKPASTVGGVGGGESPMVQHNTPSGATHAMARPGRKPKGFLSFMSSKSTSGVTATKPQVKPVQSRRMPIAPRTISTATEPQVKPVQSRRMPIAPRTISTATELATSCSSSNTNHLHSLQNHEVISSESRDSSVRHHSEEPTSISEYFLSNIFTEVEEKD
ncbi:transcription factor TFIIIB component B'' homolog isoform X4 [Clupea harengus]|uniref:Transcription factor TFIIIB component B'' homolog isoform X4 n=1 Tax=Clupea harengus TaxID=7950 RepID=A0A6P8G3L2_CLUHA|nr:transcription factor TFIIIB component B'' homolog isoform X4 [Clupea harengus]